MHSLALVTLPVVPLTGPKSRGLGGLGVSPKVSAKEYSAASCVLPTHVVVWTFGVVLHRGIIPR